MSRVGNQSVTSLRMLSDTIYSIHYYYFIIFFPLMSCIQKTEDRLHSLEVEGPLKIVETERAVA